MLKYYVYFEIMITITAGGSFTVVIIYDSFIVGNSTQWFNYAVHV
jgi:hypothetical protein